MRRRRWLWTGILTVIVLVAVRAALPYWVTDWVNRKLEDMGDYRGKVADVDLHLWKGAYSIHDLEITKRDTGVPVPFLDAPLLDVGLSWRAILDGRIVATTTLWDPQVNFVDGRDDDNLDGLGVDWRARLESLAPIDLNTFVVRRGHVWFRNFISDPKVDHQVSEVELVINGLTNRPRDRGRSANFELTGQVLEEAPLTSEGDFDPLGPFEDFHLKLKAESIELNRLNEFLRAYANLDVESGNGSFLMELDAKDDALTGYAKPLFRDVRVFSWKHDVEQQHDSPFRVLWESIAGGLENLFKNQREDQIATRVDISGELGDAEVSTLQAIAGILVNAFVDAYRPRFEDLPEREDHDSARVDSARVDRVKFLHPGCNLHRPLPFPLTAWSAFHRLRSGCNGVTTPILREGGDAGTHIESIRTVSNHRGQNDGIQDTVDQRTRRLRVGPGRV